MKRITESNRPEQIPVVGEYDVVVCGAGTAGFPAAISAARQGAKVALIERYGFLGGVPAYSIMPAWHGLSIHHSGLLTEFANRVAAFEQGPNPFKDNNHIEPETVKMLELQMVLEEPNIELHLHNMIVGAIKADNQVIAVVTESKSGRRAFVGKTFVDATGDGDLSYHAGATYRKGDNGKMQAMSLRFRIGHIDFDRYLDWAAEHPEYYKGQASGSTVVIKDMNLLKEKARKGEAFFMQADLGELFQVDPDPDLPRNSYFNASSIRPNELSINGTRIYNVDGTIEEDLTKAEILCRKQAYALWRFLRRRVPGFEKSMIVDIPAQVGVRETRSVDGDYILTEADCRVNRRFEDSVMTTRIAFDIHDVDKYTMETIKGTVDVPYRCFLAKDLNNLLIAGRNISADHVALSTIRKMETAFQSGQAAGTAAGMAAVQGLLPRQLKIGDLQQRLLDSGCKISQEYRSPDIGNPGKYVKQHEGAALL